MVLANLLPLGLLVTALKLLVVGAFILLLMELAPQENHKERGRYGR